MANIYDILIIPTCDLNTLGIYDHSLITEHVTSPTYTIEVPGFETVTGLAFTQGALNIYDSIALGISSQIEPLPDGIYCISYIVPSSGTTTTTTTVVHSLIPPPDLSNILAEKKWLRVEKLMEKFDKAFMKLDIMECDKALKKQAQVDLMSIYFFIQGAIASANNCAVVEATKLYQKADAMLNSFIGGNCGCSGNNYILNFS
jgi:hypothetical protein